MSMFDKTGRLLPEFSDKVIRSMKSMPVITSMNKSAIQSLARQMMEAISLPDKCLIRICPRCSKWHWSKVYECKRCGLWYNEHQYVFGCGDMSVSVVRTIPKTIVFHDDWHTTLNFPVSLKITEEELCKYLILE